MEVFFSMLNSVPIEKIQTNDPYPKVFIYDSTRKQFVVHTFYKCSIRLFLPSNEVNKNSLNGTEVLMTYSKERNGIFLKKLENSEVSNNGFSKVLFRHAEECPIRELEFNLDLQKQLPVSPKPLYIRVAVSILIENENTNRVLLTQRPSHMRTFPDVWVLPGGHVESGESLEISAAREVLEETGLKIDPNLFEVFFLYESVFPVLTIQGSPTRHHIVVFLKAKISENNFESCKFDSEEVGAAAWLSSSIIEEAIKSSNYSTENTFSGIKFNSFSKTWESSEFRVSNLIAKKDEKGWYYDEHLSTGSRYALEEWLKLKK